MEFFPNKKFLTDPAKGISTYQRNCSRFDINQNNNELDMGTDFDDFTEKAFHLSKMYLKALGKIVLYYFQ